VTPPAQEQTEVINLMDALKKSVQQVKPPARASSNGKKPAKAPSARERSSSKKTAKRKSG
jgi:non-homologous end joining protein Ku